MLQATGRQHRGCIIQQTQSSAPEDGRNHRPKHVELIGITNKPLLLHLVGCLYYIDDARLNKYFTSFKFNCGNYMWMEK